MRSLLVSRRSGVNRREAVIRRIVTTAAALAATLGLASLGFAGAGAAQAVSNDPAPLALAAVGQAGSYFDVTLNPGASVTLQVARTNPGTTDATAHSFAGSVFTIVNGGFGAGDGTGAPTGATNWVNYPDQVFALAAGATDVASFSVHVPAGTAPGQYISSIVLQNNVAAAGQGQVALDRIVRQAVAISIRVPGALHPKFSLGAASHESTGGRSVVSVALSNTGNQNLKPAGTMTVKDANQKVVSQAPVTMGSVYAGMDTKVAVTFGGLFLPGEYTVTLTLSDASTGASADITDVPFTVVPPATQTQTPLAPLPAIVQDAIDHPGLNTLILMLIGLCVVAGIVVAVRALRRLRAKVKATGDSDNSSDSEVPPTL